MYVAATVLEYNVCKTYMSLHLRQSSFQLGTCTFDHWVSRRTDESIHHYSDRLFALQKTVKLAHI